jgi:hypothetical protein
MLELTADLILDADPKATARERERLRGQERRKRDKEKREREASEKKASEAKSFPEYWQQQLHNLSDEQRSEFEQRESDVLDLEFAMRKYVAGTYEEQTDPENVVPLEAIIEEVKLEVSTRGLCEAVILVVPHLWTADEKDLRERIVAKGGPTVDLLNHGYRTGIDSRLYQDFFNRFLVKHTEIPASYSTLTCVCGDTTSVHVSVAKSYLGRVYECGRCLDKKAKSEAAFRKEIAVEYRSPQSIIFDSFGRLRDE